MPTSIEGALREAGFSNTEILIIRRLIEDRMCTLRQLAGKTGKSTGVLDQAMKKLIKRNIAERTMVNGNPSFSLKSMDVISRIIEDDVEHKREALQRRHKNFEAFISSITLDKRHPEMEMFSEAEGIKRAYCKLLEHGTELLAYQTSYEGGSDPHWPDFLAQLCRERRRRKIHARVIAHDTLAGRKLQSRDHLELRKTVLVPFDDCPFTFDKFIIGDHIACINHAERRACIIRYPEMAQTERGVFESVWRERAVPREGKAAAIAAPAPVVPWKVRTIVQLKQFFLAPRSLAIFAGLALVAGGITHALYRQNVYLNTQRVREQVKAIAATAALQFDWKDLEELRTIEDIQKPEYSKVIYQLNEVRRMNPQVQYAYILRKTVDDDVLQFVADADSLDPSAVKDLNNDGKTDDADALNYPGEPYDVSGFFAFHSAFEKPSADDFPYTDQWGTFYTGAAPIHNDAKSTVAIIAVDIFADNVGDLTKNSFSILGTFFGMFLFFVLIRLAAFNRILCIDLLEIFRRRSVVLLFVLCFALALAATTVLAWHNAALSRQSLANSSQMRILR
jgi:hypothetical protein